MNLLLTTSTPKLILGDLGLFPELGIIHIPVPLQCALWPSLFSSIKKHSSSVSPVPVRKGKQWEVHRIGPPRRCTNLGCVRDVKTALHLHGAILSPSSEARETFQWGPHQQSRLCPASAVQTPMSDSP